MMINMLQMKIKKTLHINTKGIEKMQIYKEKVLTLTHQE
jgi:hypothetical protein